MIARYQAGINQPTVYCNCWLTTIYPNRGSAFPIPITTVTLSRRMF